MQVKSPSIVSKIVSHGDKRNSRQLKHHFAGVCMATAILLKERNKDMTGIQTLIFLLLFTSNIQKQVYGRLNHIGVCLSYSGTRNLVAKISENMKAPIAEWIHNHKSFKFVGDNVDKHKGVRDIRSDHYGKLIHMYSQLTVKSRVSIDAGLTVSTSLSATSFLPTKEDIQSIKMNLTILVSRILLYPLLSPI